MNPILFALAAFISTISGGLVGIKNRKHLHLIISFTAGVLVAVAFFDVVPEIASIANSANLDISRPMVALVLGFLAIHTLEKIAVIHTQHETEYADHRHPLVGHMGAAGLVVHSFLDGLGIGLGFHASFHIGILISIAVIAHDFTDGLNTVSIMLMNKNTLKRSAGFLLADALAPILGVAATFIFTIPDRWLVLYLGFFAGFLLYIGASDLLPEAHSKRSSAKMIALTCLGALFIFVVTRFT